MHILITILYKCLFVFNILMEMENLFCNILVGVLPISILADLIKRKVYPIKPIMKRVKIGESFDLFNEGIIADKYEFQFQYFERIKKIDIITERI